MMSCNANRGVSVRLRDKQAWKGRHGIGPPDRKPKKKKKGHRGRAAGGSLAVPHGPACGTRGGRERQPRRPSDRVANRLQLRGARLLGGNGLVRGSQRRILAGHRYLRKSEQARTAPPWPLEEPWQFHSILPGRRTRDQRGHQHGNRQFRLARSGTEVMHRRFHHPIRRGDSGDAIPLHVSFFLQGTAPMIKEGK